MADPSPLTDEQIAAALADLPGWSRDGDALVRSYSFDDFRAAMGFIVQMGFVAEDLNHHPDLRNVWNRVTLRLSTHDAGDRITDRDVAFARAVASLVA